MEIYGFQSACCFQKVMQTYKEREDLEVWYMKRSVYVCIQGYIVAGSEL